MHFQKWNYDFPSYFKVFIGLLAFGFFSALLCYFSFSVGLAAEPESEETLYSDDTYTLLPDGTIIESTQEDAQNVIEDNVSVVGSDESESLPDEESSVSDSESLSGEISASDAAETQVSDSPVIIFADNVSVQSLSDSDTPAVMAFSADDDVISLPEDACVSYKVRVDGNDYTAVFPVSAADSLSVSDGVLLNVGSSTVTGRLFTDSFDTGTYGNAYVTLYSVLSTSGNTNAYRYGAWSYITRYAPSSSGSSSLTSSVTYCNIYVLEEPGACSTWTSFELVQVTLLLLLILLPLVTNRRRTWS